MHYQINIREIGGGRIYCYVSTKWGADTTEIAGKLDDAFAWVKKALSQFLQETGKYPDGSED